ncbi:hypothetical protein M011DRAFT_298545 [Sporormia fimetaria CBS 119925]|uniref:Metallothionein n=1 Tax=Sporormia fimetaria CBS 119925 TaxID=1340428 RepID=A0A6A6UV19_9PLEO|nr:hypothetical protein M011DRAFT_298545 [Sporormia fimetaria CBS 119925]
MTQMYKSTRQVCCWRGVSKTQFKTSIQSTTTSATTNTRLTNLHIFTMPGTSTKCDCSSSGNCQCGSTCTCENCPVRCRDPLSGHAEANVGSAQITHSLPGHASM